MGISKEYLKKCEKAFDSGQKIDELQQKLNRVLGLDIGINETAKIIYDIFACSFTDWSELDNASETKNSYLDIAITINDSVKQKIQEVVKGE